MAAITRASGRKSGAIRDVTIELGIQRNAAGSCLVRTGGTAVVCAATIEDRVPHFLRGAGAGWVTAEYALMPGSTTTRSQRDGRRGGVGGRTHEIQRLIGRSLRAVVDLKGLGERQITVDCDVLEADGGTRTASITGAFVALVLAVRSLEAAEQLAGSVFRDYVAAVSVGVVGGEVLVDLEYTEDRDAEVDMNVVMTGAGDFVEIQGTAERRTFSADELAGMLEGARRGIRKLVRLQRATLSDAGVKRLP